MALSKHDKGVKKIADYWQSQGISKNGIYADIPGYKKPKLIKDKKTKRRYRPDAIIRTDGEERIYEVETKQSDKKDKPQQKSFRDYANRSAYRTYIKKVVK